MGALKIPNETCGTACPVRAPATVDTNGYTACHIVYLWAALLPLTSCNGAARVQLSCYIGVARGNKQCLWSDSLSRCSHSGGCKPCACIARHVSSKAAR